MISQERVNELCRAGKAGDRDAYRQVVEANLRLVVSVAWKYAGRGVELQDLISMGNLGLMKAAERFDPELGHRFSTYALWWIKQALTRGISETSNTVRCPAYIWTALGQASKWEREHRRPITLAEFATLPRVTHSIAQRALEWRRKHQVSLDGPTAGDGPNMAGLIEGDTPSQQGQVELGEQLEQLREGIEELPPRTQEILRLRYGLDGGDTHTLLEIGQRVGVTRERVRQIITKAERDLLLHFARVG